MVHLRSTSSSCRGRCATVENPQPTGTPHHRPAEGVSTLPHLGDVGELGHALSDVPGGGQDAGVDDHDVGELGSEAQLDGDAAAEVQVAALREHCRDSEHGAGTSSVTTTAVTLGAAPVPSPGLVVLHQRNPVGTGDAACHLAPHLGAVPSTSPQVPALGAVAAVLTVGLGPLQVPGRGLVPARGTDGVRQRSPL